MLVGKKKKGRRGYMGREKIIPVSRSSSVRRSLSRKSGDSLSPGQDLNI